MRLTLRMDALSTAEMILTAEEPEIAIGDWMELFSPGGSAGIFRVSAVETDFGSGLRRVRLEHGFAALRDCVIFGTVTPEQITGEAGAKTAAVDAAIRYLLTAYQTQWTLERCDYPDEMAVSFADASLMGALTDLSDALGGRWQFDQTQRPWRLSLVRPDAQEKPTCELRMDRSIAGMQLTLDRTDMYTRIYPQGQDGLTIAEVNDGVPYLEMNTEAWGVVASIDQQLDITDPALLMASAQAKLAAHAAPMVSVVIDGFALAEATGEPLDRLTVGRICRVPLPEQGPVITQRIIELRWKDVLGDPQRVTVTMANQRETVSALAGAAIRRQRRTNQAILQKVSKVKYLEAVKAEIEELLAGDVSYGTLSGGRLMPTDIEADGTIFGEGLTISGGASVGGLEVDGMACGAVSVNDWNRTSEGGVTTQTLCYLDAEGNEASLEVVTGVTLPVWTSERVSCLGSRGGEE